jgi:hypothetical protein
MLNVRFEVYPRSVASVEGAIRALQALLPLAREWEAADACQFSECPVCDSKNGAPDSKNGAPDSKNDEPAACAVDGKGLQKAPNVSATGGDESWRVPVPPVRVYSGEELRKAAIAAAKRTSAQRVREFIAGLGLRSIVDVAPEDSAAVMDQLEAIR